MQRKVKMETQLYLSKLKQFTTDFVETKLPLREEILSKSKQVLDNLDFPTTRDEQWKYTRLTKLSQLSLIQTPNAQSESTAILNNSQVIPAFMAFLGFIGLNFRKKSQKFLFHFLSLICNRGLVSGNFFKNFLKGIYFIFTTVPPFPGNRKY